uniref:F-box domain-containing protein n=1 Tax=Moniliophthora roreri TaxID=221103 RepID=A0A0W0G634_MONRR
MRPQPQAYLGVSRPVLPREHVLTFYIAVSTTPSQSVNQLLPLSTLTAFEACGSFPWAKSTSGCTYVRLSTPRARFGLALVHVHVRRKIAQPHLLIEQYHLSLENITRLMPSRAYQTCYLCGTVKAPNTYRRQLEDYPRPPDHLLRSNDIAGYPEDVHLSTFYASAKKDRAWLQSNLEYLENHVLPSLRKSLARVNKVVDEYAVALSPVRALPTEVLITIMSLCVTEEGVDLLNIRSSSAWSASQVCRRWRDIALDIPSLWSHINIDLRKQESFLYGPRYIGLPSILKMFFDRSHPLLLRTTFACDSATHLAKSLLATLFQYSYRWRTVDIDVVPALAFNSASRVTEAPHLESLKTNWMFFMQEHNYPASVISLSGNASQLRSLSLLGERRGAVRELSTIALPWTQLTTLNVEGNFVTDFIILAMTPNIRTCHLITKAVALDAPPIDIRLTKLRTLKLTGYSVYFLRSLSAPALVSLTIEDTPPQHCGVDRILPFINRSACSLQKLAFEAIPFTRQVLPLLQAVPTLAGLYMDIALQDDSLQFDLLLSALMYSDPGHDCVLPRLKELSISTYSHNPINASILVDMVKSRRLVGQGSGVTRLHRFYLRTNAEWNKLFDELKSLKEEGFDVDFDLH